MSDHDVHEALDRLARVADPDPSSQLLTGIHAEARRNRNRSVAVAGASLAAVVVIGYAAWAATSGVDTAREPDFTEPTSVVPTPSPSETDPAVQLMLLDSRRADVDGDGTRDVVRLLVPRGQPRGEVADESWLEVRTATTTTAVQLTGTPTYVGFYDTAVVDLDGTGGEEILMFETGGGESGALSVWTWSDGLVRVDPAEDSPPFLVNEAGLASGGEELSVAYQDGHLLSWQVVEPGSQEVAVWQWSLDDGTLTAVVQLGTQCVSLGVVKPC